MTLVNSQVIKISTQKSVEFLFLKKFIHLLEREHEREHVCVREKHQQGGGWAEGQGEA